MDKVLERIKELKDEESRYAYADAVTNAFLTGQIKALREERNLTQEKLAELVGTQQSGISRWLNSGFSTCKVETLRKFAKAYGVRLRITFEEFGTLPTDVRGFTKDRLAPRKFEDDTAFKEPASEPEPKEAIVGTQSLQGPPRIGKNTSEQQLTVALGLAYQDMDSQPWSMIESARAHPMTVLEQFSGGMGLTPRGAGGEANIAPQEVIKTGEMDAIITNTALPGSKSWNKVVEISTGRHRAPTQGTHRNGTERITDGRRRTKKKA